MQKSAYLAKTFPERILLQRLPILVKVANPAVLMACDKARGITVAVTNATCGERLIDQDVNRNGIVFLRFFLNLIYMATKTMSSAKEVVNDFLQAMNKSDYKTARRYVNDDFRFEGVLGSRNGADAYFKDMEHLKFKYDEQEIFVEGDDVCVLYNIDMSGEPVFTCGWYKVKDDKIESLRVVFDPRPLLQKPQKKSETDITGFRYIVNDVEEAVKFYTELLDFEVKMHVPPGFAKLSKGNMNLFINKPGYGGAGQSMPDGTTPEPGGWNRFHAEVNNIEKLVEKMKSKGAQFRSDIMTGQGGKQVLLQDPSGNLVELFENKKQ